MVCVETLLVRGDLLRMFQQAFPGAKRDLSAIYVLLQRSRPVRKSKNTFQIDPIIHRPNTSRCVGACMHANVCCFKSLCIQNKQICTRLYGQVWALAFRQIKLLISEAYSTSIAWEPDESGSSCFICFFIWIDKFVMISVKHVFFLKC